MPNTANMHVTYTTISIPGSYPTTAPTAHSTANWTAIAASNTIISIRYLPF